MKKKKNFESTMKEVREGIEETFKDLHKIQDLLNLPPGLNKNVNYQ